MKKIIIVLFLFAIIPSISGQNCQEMAIDFFEYAKENVHIFNIDDVNNEELLAFGECFVNSEKFETLSQNFIIDDDLILNYPDIVFLILQSGAFETDMDRQHWFSLYSKMDDEKLYKLQKILFKVINKIVKIENDHEKHIAALLTKNFEMGVIDSINATGLNGIKVLANLKHDSTSSIHIWKFVNDDILVNSENANLKIHKDSLKYIYVQSTENLDEQFDEYRFEKLIEDYVEELIFMRKIDKERFMINFPEYFTASWKNSIEIFKNNNNVLLDSLLAFNIEDFILEGEHKKNIKRFRYFNLYSYGLNSKNYNQAAFGLMNLLNINSIEIPFDELCYFLYDFTILQLNNVNDSYLQDIENSLIKIINRLNVEEISISGMKQTVAVQFIILDFVSYYCSSQFFKEKTSIWLTYFHSNKFIVDKSVYTEDWYFNLSNIYFNNIIEKELNVEELLISINEKFGDKKKVFEAGEISMFDLIDNKPKVFEQVLYSILAITKNDLDFEKNEISKLLNWAEQYSNKNDEEVYSYIEKHLISILKNTSNSSKRYYGKKYAIVIGVSDYKDFHPPPEKPKFGELYDLKYADNDANEFTNFLMDSRYSGTDWILSKYVDGEAEKYEIENRILEILDNAQKQDLIYFFFSGHGVLVNDDDYFLIPYDYQIKYPSSGLNYDWLLKQVSNSKAKHIVLFLDACHSGAVDFGKGLENNDNLKIKSLQNKPQKIIFYSSRDKQKSYESDEFQQGVFSHFLLKGLKGAAPEKSRDNYVNIAELQDYLSQEIKKYSKEYLNNRNITPGIEGLQLIEDNYPLSVRY